LSANSGLAGSNDRPTYWLTVAALPTTVRVRSTARSRLTDVTQQQQQQQQQQQKQHNAQLTQLTAVDAIW